MGSVASELAGEPAGTTSSPREGIGPAAAAALVFATSGAVLVVELAMLRLLAPHLGLTLETSTLVIGMALTAIALGSWAGGRAADVVPPRRMLGPLLAVSGVAVAATPFAVRSAATGGDGSLIFLVASTAMLVPGAALSAVTPIVTKLRLTSLTETGTIVGRLSAIATVGAIAGTVLTGFVLVSAVRVSTILVGLGALLVVGAVLVELRVGGLRRAALPGVLVALGGVGAAAAPGGCDVETIYHCASVVTDPVRPTGRVLLLDNLRHSYVDLEDPTYLEFEYARVIASLIDTAFPADEPLRAYHVGGGGLTLPRYLDQVRPGTTSVVSEIDPGVLEVDRERLALETGDGIEVRVEDARLGVGRLEADSRDLVVGDAFGGVSVPWHLTTREALAQVRRVLTPEGVYAANLIDYRPLAFARAEAATLAEVFPQVVLVARPDAADEPAGGNLVLLASDRPLDLEAFTERLGERTGRWRVFTGDTLTEWVGDAPVLRDDYAPVDQLLTPYPVP